jgi:hypothetical protein
MVQGVEKEFLLKSFYDDQTDIMCRHNRLIYTMQIEKLERREIAFKTKEPISGLTPGNRLDLTVDYKGVIVVFVVEVCRISETGFVASFPGVLYKNLDRAYPRVTFPEEMHLRFAFTQERYFLPFSGSKKTAPPGAEEILASPGDSVNAIAEALALWVKESAGEYKFQLFKEAQPASLEEQILVKTGKILFLPSTKGEAKEALPEKDPGNNNRCITKEIFQETLQDLGIGASRFEGALNQFILAKRSKNIAGDLWIPLNFKEYTAGYIHYWTVQEDKPPLAYQTGEKLFQYANSLVQALEKQGYFEAFTLKDKFISVQGVNISAGGVLFSYPKSYIAEMLDLNAEITLKLLIPKRTVTVKTKILRRQAEKRAVYFGCHFLGMAPEDVRFLYEYIYGKAFAESGSILF